MPKRRGGRRAAGDASSASRKSTALNTNREEGVLYTVDVMQRPPKGPKGDSPQPPQSDDMLQPHQYTISKMNKNNGFWMTRLCYSFGFDFSQSENVDSYLYRPSKPLAGYINWTFYASFTAVFVSFLAIFLVLCLVFAGLYALSGHIYPECIVVSGEPYGTNPESKFGDAFALSWTTFTTVGYGNVYTATGNDFEASDSEDCSGVVFLCTLESFMGLIYAGMCAAILFGKVNRVQSHAHLTFANAVCLQYEDVDSKYHFVDDDSSDSDVDDFVPEEPDDSKRISKVQFQIEPEVSNGGDSPRSHQRIARASFIEKFNGCPVLKFQVVNDFCNKVGGEIIDAVMKVVGIKMKTRDGKVTHSQYVRVDLLDFEHPFFGRVWHGVHVLDGNSPLLTDMAKKKIRKHGNAWPENWLTSPEKIRRKLDFHSLIMTVAGVSNISACTVHAYKRYKFHDVIIGFDFAPLVYENESMSKLVVDMQQANDVRERHKGSGEDLNSVHIPFEGEKRSSEQISEGSTGLDRKAALATKFQSTRFQRR